MAEEDGRSPSSKSALPIAAMAEEASSILKARLRYNSKIYCNIYQRFDPSRRRHVGHNHFPFGFALSPTH